MVVEQLWQPVPGGSGTYIVELARALRERGVRLAGLAASHGSSPTLADVGLPPMPTRFTHLPRTALYESWNWLRLPRAEAILPGAQVVHATTWAIPGTRLPLAVTVHDVAFLRSPEHFTRRGNAYFQRALERTRHEADAVIVPSQATADDCIRAGLDGARIQVIPHGVRPLPVTGAQVAAFRATHGLEREYVLWTGTREPRKNLPVLLRAFALFAADHPDLDLVLVGPAGWGDDAEERALAAELPGRIHVLGHLSNADLAAAYRGARAFVFPSIWEGFGLPVLEAMAYGTPVVTSRGTCMEEVCGDAGLLADADAPEQIAAQLVAATGEAHDDLAAAGLERARTFTWEECAAAHAQVYSTLAAGASR
ncbi:MAG: glycosyltransferase family 4 protein [Actinomyces succiniciruminis]|nr:glycosyltransferase family 4 protein [Actinomyces succiniciruminis]